MRSTAEARHRVSSLLERLRPRTRRSTVFAAIALIVVVAVVIEGARWVRFYQHAEAAQSSVQALKQRLELASLTTTPDEVRDIRTRLVRAESELAAAERHLDTDPLAAVGGRLPWVSTQADGLSELVTAARASTVAGLAASEVLMAYAEHSDDPDRSAVQEGVDFLQSQTEAMATVRLELERTKAARADISGGLTGPLAGAVDDLDEAIAKLEGLVTGYERAAALLPALLGFEGPRTYLLLAQNNTELYPSGGLISNYGLMTFEDGRVSGMQFEYFVDLYRRWQRESGREYVEPPAPLKNYLLRDTSWALGEAGWYPDFPTTAGLAASFVQKGGAQPTDGTIAIDLVFVEELLRLLGPLTVEEYGVRVTANDLTEVMLEQTRDQSSIEEAPGKDFVSALARQLMAQLFAAPRGKWVDLVQLLDRMGRERHLQLNFADPGLQALGAEYGFDGSLPADDADEVSGDFLLLTDTSVNGTKLNLILEHQLDVRVRLEANAAATTATYTTTNPFPRWQQGRDPRLVEALMRSGIYGSYLRLYAPPDARFLDLRVDSRPAGAEQIDIEAGKRVFSRYVTISPGATKTVEFHYRSEAVIEPLEDGWLRYRLHVQKQPGTRATPLTLHFELPDGADVRSVTLDGSEVSTSIETDLRVDRAIEVVFRPGQ